MFPAPMTGDVNAAIRGAFEGGAEVTVTDGHSYSRNILIEELDRAPESCMPSALSMVQGVDQDVQGVMFWRATMPASVRRTPSWSIPGRMSG